MRSPDEWVDELGHMDGARLMPIKDRFEQVLETLDPRRPTLFICRSGGRSMKAAMLARERGFQQIYNMTGGMPQWVANGLPTLGATKAS